MTELEAWLDGTQQPPPEPLFPDPLAGLITGEVMPDEPATPVLVTVPAPAPAPAGGRIDRDIGAMLVQEPPRRQRKNPRPPARPARQQIRTPTRQSRPGVSIATLVITLFVLFLIARAVIAAINGS